jgi:hypothetical protein
VVEIEWQGERVEGRSEGELVAGEELWDGVAGVERR